MARIRYTRTEIWEYEPDFDSIAYTDAGITDITSALELDMKDVSEGRINMSDLCDDFPNVNELWEIVDGGH